MNENVRIILFIGTKTRVFNFSPADGDIHVVCQGKDLRCSVTQQTELDFDKQDSVYLFEILDE